ncbi:hypothetical protein D3C73_1660270 [compost metagenome]
MDLRSALTNEDASSSYGLAVCTLHAKTLRDGITTVLCGTYTLLGSEQLKIQL